MPIPSIRTNQVSSLICFFLEFVRYAVTRESLFATNDSNNSKVKDYYQHLNGTEERLINRDF